MGLDHYHTTYLDSQDSLCFHTSSAPPSYIHLPLLTSSSSIRFLTDSVQLLLTSFVLLYQRSQSRTCVRRILSGHKTKRLLSDVNRLPQLHFKDFFPIPSMSAWFFFVFGVCYSSAHYLCYYRTNSFRITSVKIMHLILNIYWDQRTRKLWPWPKTENGDILCIDLFYTDLKMNNKIKTISVLQKKK